MRKILLKNQPMTRLERRSVAVLAGIYGLRILGLFLILPVFSLYAAQLQGNTPFLIGMALGIYGLTNAILQIPLGTLSDHIGRKPVIAAGLLIFACGSVVAAVSDSITGVIIGRAIQGAGAIAAAAMALAADLTSEEQRTKAMAVIGITIGVAFVLSMVLGPLLNRLIGVPGIFWLIAVLALAAIGLLFFGVPTPVRTQRAGPKLAQFARTLKNGHLLRLDIGIFCLHLVLTAMFVVLPGAMVENAGLPVNQHWRIYLPTILASLVTMAPFVLFANRKQKMSKTLAAAVFVLIGAESIFFFGYHSLAGLAAGLWLFFSALNLLEALLPSLVSRLAPVESKGAAIGVYSTAQFLGAFAGGSLGGLVHGHVGIGGVFLFALLVLVGWFLLALTMPEPKFLVTHILPLKSKQLQQPQALARQLAAIPGVAEAVVIPEEGVVYLKVDPALFSEQAMDLSHFQA